MTGQIKRGLSLIHIWAVQLITDPEHPVNADRLLIVTFTNAAAAELRARIGQALLHRSQLQPGNCLLYTSRCV